MSESMKDQLERHLETLITKPAAAQDGEPQAQADNAPTPTPSSAPAEALAAEQKIEPKYEPKSQTVPLPELIEERKRRQAMERELEDFRKQSTERERQFAEKLASIEKMLAPKDEPAKPKPDPILEPEKYIESLTEQVNQRLTAAEQKWQAEEARRAQEESQRKQQSEAVQQALGVVGAIQSDVSEYAKSTTDYMDAVNHWRETKLTQFRAQPDALVNHVFEQAKPQLQLLEQLGVIGRGMSSAVDGESRRVALLLAEEATTLATAKQLQINPAEYLYSQAKAFGYAPKTATAPTATDQKLETIAKGMRESTPPTSGGGGGSSLKNGSVIDNILGEVRAETAKAFR